MTYCRPATIYDCYDLSTRLRQSDQREIMASHGFKPLHALLQAFAQSDICRVFCTPDDEPLCIFGTVPYTLNVASVWMLGSDRIADYRRDFLKHSRLEINKLLEKYNFLFNLVDERNSPSIRWLRWLGAMFTCRHPHHGVSQIPFLEFQI